MNTPDATFKNGRYELPRHARGVLVLADPPEAGWRLQTHSNTAGTRTSGHCRMPKPTTDGTPRAEKGTRMSDNQSRRPSRSHWLPRRSALIAAVAAMLAAVAIAVAGCGGGAYSSSPAPGASASPAAPSSSAGIPQNNGGDHDADNNGGPSDGDGQI
jgi:hypothetical protein